MKFLIFFPPSSSTFFMISFLTRSFLLLFCSWSTKIIYIKWQLHNKSACSIWVHRASQEVPEVAKIRYLQIIDPNIIFCYSWRICAEFPRSILHATMSSDLFFRGCLSPVPYFSLFFNDISSFDALHLFWPSAQFMSDWEGERIEPPESRKKKKPRNSLRWDLYCSSAINVKERSYWILCSIEFTWQVYFWCVFILKGLIREWSYLKEKWRISKEIKTHCDESWSKSFYEF